ncbi:MAG: cation diffusion facilitator family transporter [Opitutales bacterium]
MERKDALSPEEESRDYRLRAWMRLSLAVGLVLLALKLAAWLWTGSSAIFSDAAESVVHLFAVLFAAFSMRLSRKPPDSDHLYGHAKVSFFSAITEGLLILLASVLIYVEAVRKLVTGVEVAHLGAGLGLTVLAGSVSGLLGLGLIRAGRRHQSIILEANGRHILTDCITSLGVVVGLLLAMGTGWVLWDPIFALLVAGNIMATALRLIRRGIAGLMDRADPQVQAILEEHLNALGREYTFQYHRLRHRETGDGTLVDFDLLLPDRTSLKEAHRIATEVERRLQEKLSRRAHVTTHLEPAEDHARIHPKARD